MCLLSVSSLLYIVMISGDFASNENDTCLSSFQDLNGPTKIQWSNLCLVWYRLNQRDRDRFVVDSCISSFSDEINDGESVFIIAICFCANLHSLLLSALSSCPDLRGETNLNLSY